jgi:hypothetical protein
MPLIIAGHDFEAVSELRKSECRNNLPDLEGKAIFGLP